MRIQRPAAAVIEFQQSGIAQQSTSIGMPIRVIQDDQSPRSEMTQGELCAGVSGSITDFSVDDYDIEVAA